MTRFHFFMLITICFAAIETQAQTQDPSKSASKMFRTYSTHEFQKAGIDIKKYAWDTPQANSELNIAEKNFRISKGLLGGGIVSSVFGSGLLITAGLESKRNSLTSTTTPFIISGAALNLVCMPVCFAVREIIRKKAAKHVLVAKALITP